jgi:CBS domain-containing protein
MSEPISSAQMLAAPPEIMDDDPLVSTFMTRDVVALDAGADVGSALREMARHGVRHLVVLVGEQVDGAVTEATVVRAIADDRAGTPVGQLRIRLPLLSPSARRSDVARRMVDHRVDAVIIVTDPQGTVAGIATATDLLRSLAG